MPRVRLAALAGIGLVALTAAAAAAQAPGAAVAFGTRHAVALRTNGDVLTWGDNVSCQLGRAAGNGSRTPGNGSRTPGIVMRNATAVAAASEHTLVLADGKVYGWGSNAEGVLGTGDTYDKCEGPALAESLAGQTVTKIATGYGFSVAVTSTGDLYCTGDTSVGQCGGRGGRLAVFTKVSIPELAGAVVDVRTGAFHTLVLLEDGRLFAFGRGREGQLGTGRTTNGGAFVAGMTDVVAFAAGAWHSVAAKADGSVWTWGADAKGQLCDGSTTNRATPARVTLPRDARIAEVAAGHEGTLLRTVEGSLIACGDNQFGPLGLPQPAAPQPTPVPTARSRTLLGMGGANAALSVDGCGVSLVGANDHGIVSTADSGTVRTFFQRPDLSLCATRAATALPTIVNPAPRGGEAGCWTKRTLEDGAASTTSGPRPALLAAEALLRNNAAFMASPQPSRFRTSISTGPPDDAGARMHIKVVPERKPDGTRLWSAGCDVIPQIDRIGGAIAQVSIFFNQQGQFISPVGTVAKRTGTVAGHPEYEGWVLITKDGRVPWIPETLADRLDAEGAKRERALADAQRRPAAVADGTAGDLEWLEKQVKDYRDYRASFSADQLRAPGVWGDPTGAGRKRLDADIAAMRNLSVEDQRRFDALGLESRTLERQAQAETRAGNAAEATRLRERSRALGLQAREIQRSHMTRVSGRIVDALATYDLTNLRSGAAADAMRVKANPVLPDPAQANRIQMIAILFSFGPKPAGSQLDWQTKVKESFDFAALAALLR